MGYIDKSALVKKIERRRDAALMRQQNLEAIGQETVLNEMIAFELNRIISLIDTLEVKDFWKPADGDDLPEIDREVIALLDNGKVVFAHRPPEYWDGKDIITGKVTRNYPKTYDKGGWNIPDVKYWLDVKLPEETEL